MVGPAGDTKLITFEKYVFLSPLTFEIVAPPLYCALYCAVVKQHIITRALIFSCQNNSFLINYAPLFKFVTFNILLFDVALFYHALFDAALFDVELF